MSPGKFTSVKTGNKAVREYTCNNLPKSMADYQVITPDFVNVMISTSKDDISFNEKRFPKSITTADLKVKGRKSETLNSKNAGICRGNLS